MNEISTSQIDSTVTHKEHEMDFFSRIHKFAWPRSRIIGKFREKFELKRFVDIDNENSRGQFLEGLSFWL